MGSGKKVVVGFSGGIDSFVCVYRLLLDGFEVIPVFLYLHDVFDVARAKKYAELLGVKLRVIDLREVFEKKVINYFVRYYRLGLTPNPCCICNQKIKFPYLVWVADSVGAGLIATGHYAKVRRIKEFGRQLVFRGKDRDKEQSYFLSLVSPGIIQRLMLPLGDMLKSEVVDIASRNGYSDSYESQDVCFIKGSYRSFLSEYIKPQKGDIVLKDGTVVGEHDGIINYTVGQRRGIRVSYDRPLYVISIKSLTNEVVVGSLEDLEKDRFSVRKTVWQVPFRFLGKLEGNIYAQLRYRAKPVPVSSVKHLKNLIYYVELRSKVRAVAPGQICALYSKDLLLGGGEIMPEYEVADGGQHRIS